MKPCVVSCVVVVRVLLLLLLLASTTTTAFVAPAHQHRASSLSMADTTSTTAAVQTVEVCGFKDCKRAGGGPRLQKLVNQVLEEKGMSETTTVEGCDCQGECGYGPNLVVDGKIVNCVRGRQAVLQALGLPKEEES